MMTWIKNKESFFSLNPFIFTHTYTKVTYDEFFSHFKFDNDKIITMYPETGNLATSSLPYQFFQKFKNGEIKTGTPIYFVGVAAGGSDINITWKHNVEE